MELIFVSFLAGMLTVLAPCVVTLLPVLLASSSNKQNRSAFWIIAGLSVSIIIFSVLLKSTTLLINIPQEIWRIVSGVIVLFFGITTIFPNIWDKFSQWSQFSRRANKATNIANSKTGTWWDFILGASLGPIFNACSPTYALIVAIILPANPLSGLLYLMLFVSGLAFMLILIAIFGNKIINKLGWSLMPDGLFKRLLGTVLIIVGLMIVFGIDKVLLGFLVENGWYDFQIQLESLFI